MRREGNVGGGKELVGQLPGARSRNKETRLVSQQAPALVDIIVRVRRIDRSQRLFLNLPRNAVSSL